MFVKFFYLMNTEYCTIMSDVSEQTFEPVGALGLARARAEVMVRVLAATVRASAGTILSGM